MKVLISETKNKIVDMHFDKFLKVPKWVYDYDQCDECGVQFDDQDFEDEMVVVAVSNFNNMNTKYHHYCLKCWKQEEEYMNEVRK